MIFYIIPVLMYRAILCCPKGLDWSAFRFPTLMCWANMYRPDGLKSLVNPSPAINNLAYLKHPYGPIPCLLRGVIVGFAPDTFSMTSRCVQETGIYWLIIKNRLIADNQSV
ncbi:MAG: hypothetical protein FJ041_06970 [Candidatus Cloacimonetes bacterium]|nr:hypothetical protein [Candidatus Cloacimonadota bacterium]